MEKPTEEQIKKFWGWCGFKQLPPGNTHYHFERTIKVMNWETPDGKVVPTFPVVDLNNLFKYAVPKLDYAEINYDYRQSSENGYKVTHSDFIYTATVVLDIWQEKQATLESNDPTLALFWAIWSVIQSEVKGQLEMLNGTVEKSNHLVTPASLTENRLLE